MRTILLAPIMLVLASCQGSQLRVTPQQQAAGLAALSSVLNSIAENKKPKDAALEAARAALAAYSQGQAKPTPPADKEVVLVLP